MAAPLPVLSPAYRVESSISSSAASMWSEGADSTDSLKASPPSAPGSTPRLDQPDERADHAVKQSTELWRERLHPAEGLCRFEAR